MDSRKSEVTRYLSASALLGGKAFRDRVLRYIKQQHKALAPELDYDLETVVKLCKFFESRDKDYDIGFTILILVFLASLIVFPLGLALFISFFFIFIPAWIINIKRSNYEDKILLEYFQRNKFNPKKIELNFPVEGDPTDLIASDTKQQNLIIYNRFSPFVGAGVNIGGWSFVLDLSIPKKELGGSPEVKSFTVEELYNSIEELFNKVELPNLNFKHVLFVNGSDIRQEKWILPGLYSAPFAKINDDIINSFKGDKHPRIRHYTWIQIHDWENEMVVSYFLRFSKHGNRLFVEVSTFFLPPLSKNYKKIDNLVPKGFSESLSDTLVQFFTTPFIVTNSVFTLTNRIFSVIREKLKTEEKQTKKEIMSNPLYNFGAELSLRESFASPQYQHYFQLLDREMYSKIVEMELLDGLISFLDDHNIDTSDLKERETSIINQGIIVKSGDVKAKTLAVGKGAKAQKFN